MSDRPEKKRFEGVRLLWPVWVAAFVAHIPVLWNGFISDDFALLVQNPYVRSFAGLKPLLTRELFTASGTSHVVLPYYRPIAGLTNWITWQLFHAHAWMHHAFSIVLHALLATLIVRILIQNGIARRVAVVAGVIFAVHTLTVEAVAYVNGRQMIIGWLVVLGAWMLIQRTKSLAMVAVAAGLGVLLGMLSREFFICAVILLPVAACAGISERRVVWMRFSTAFAASIAGLLADTGIRNALELTPLPGTNLFSVKWMGDAAVVSWRLLRDVVLPTDLVKGITILPIPFMFAFVVLLALAMGAFTGVRAVWERSKSLVPLTVAGIVIVASTIALTTEFAYHESYMHDRYAYDLLVGAVMLGAVGIHLAVPALRVRLPGLMAPRPLALAASALFVLTLPLTWSRVRSYANDDVQNAITVEEHPDDPYAHLIEIRRHLLHQDLELAYPHCVAYNAAVPGQADTSFCLGSWLTIHGRVEEAVPHFQAYARAFPHRDSIWIQYVAALLRAKQVEQAERAIKEREAQTKPSKDVTKARQLLAQAKTDLHLL